MPRYILYRPCLLVCPAHRNKRATRCTDPVRIEGYGGRVCIFDEPERCEKLFLMLRTSEAGEQALSRFEQSENILSDLTLKDIVEEA